MKSNDWITENIKHLCDIEYIFNTFNYEVLSEAEEKLIEITREKLVILAETLMDRNQIIDKIREIDKKEGKK